MGAGTAVRCGGTAGVARSRVASIWLFTAAPASLVGSEDLFIGLITSGEEQKKHSNAKPTRCLPHQRK